MKDKLHGQKGNSPDRQLRSQNQSKWQRKWSSENSQDVGLEAAIIQRVRNSSLVEGLCAENTPGLRLIPKLRD